MNPNAFKRILKSLPKNPKVLDAGCGTGNNSRYLLQLRPDAQITCIDLQGKYAKNVQDFATFIEGSVTDMKMIKDDKFDLIICFHLLEHIPTPADAVAEFKRVLKPNGVIACECPHWISTIMPYGFNFYDDPTHIRPFTIETFRQYLFKDFTIEYIRSEPPIFHYTPSLYNINPRSLGHLFRRLLAGLGLFRTAVFCIARIPGKK